MLPSLKDLYLSKVVHELPSTFVKDQILIKNNIRQRKITFGGNVKITAPESSFNENITILNSKNQLDDLELSGDDYSILVIKGLPFDDE
jgi:hypothetical protein